MPYAPKNWTTGEVISEAALDNIEAGIQEALGNPGIRQAILAGKVGSDGLAAFIATGTAAGLGSDLTSTSYAISGGDYSGYPKEQAFDNNNSNYWISSQTGNAIDGAAYIGQAFPSAVTIAAVKIKQDAANYASSAKIQTSSDGSTWNDHETVALAASSDNSTTLATPLTSAYVRALANSVVQNGTGGWNVQEAEFIGAVFSDLDLDTDAGASPLVLTAAAGGDSSGALDRPAAVTADEPAAWEAADMTISATNYLYADVDTDGTVSAYSSTTLAPKYLASHPASPSSGQFNYKPNTGAAWNWNGSAWVQVYRVFLGECEVDGSGNITSVTPYAIRGIYAPGRIAASASTATTKNHNLGTDNVVAMCHQATSAGGSLTPCALTGLTAKTVSFTTAASVVEVVPVVRRAF